MCIREMRLSYGRCVSDEANTEPAVISNARDVALLMAPLLEPEVTEVCHVLCLNTRMGVLGYHEVSRGSLNRAPMEGREVFKAAVIANAAGIVLVHNHPSGDPRPSPDDVAVTARLKAAGDLLGVEVLDHVIIGADGRFVSLKEQGRL
jgi:DNA repair protein RadC